MIVEPVVGVEVGVERVAVEVLVVVEDVLEHAVVDAEHDVGIHLDEAAVAVVGEALVARALAPAPSTVSSLRPRLRMVSIMPGIEARAPERTETSSGLAASPKRGADRLADLGQRRLDLGLQPVGQLAAVGVVGGADLGGDGEARRHRQAEARHLGEVGALAAEQVAQTGMSVG